MGPESMNGQVRSLIMGISIIILAACSGRNDEDSSSVPDPVPGLPPAVSLSATPTAIDPGDAVTLSWAADNATDCTASDGWTGSRGLTGSEQVSPTVSTNYTLTCDGADGSDSQSVAVTVNGTPAPAPIVNFSAADLVVDSGDNTMLDWSSQNADSCQASGGWSGDKSLLGSESVGPITAATTYTISCTGSGGTAIEMLTVSVFSSISLDWVAPTENEDGSPLNNLASFRVYYGAGPGSYDDSFEIADPLATSQTVSVVSGTYYVAMTALDTDGNESAFSNEVIKFAD